MNDPKCIIPVTDRSGTRPRTEYQASYDGQLIGYFPNYLAADEALNDYVLDLAQHGLIDTIALDPDPAPPVDDGPEDNWGGFRDLPNGWMLMPEGDILDTDGMRVKLADPSDGLPDVGPPDDLPGADPSPGRCLGCAGPCFDCGAIDMPALGRRLRREMSGDRAALFHRLRATQRRFWPLLAHAYAMEVGNTPSCDRQPTEPGILWLWSTLLWSAA